MKVQTLFDSIIIDDEIMCDVEMLLCSAFSPLKGFMCERDYNSVVENCRLSSGKLWPMPIVLPVTKANFINVFVEDPDVIRIPRFLELYAELKKIGILTVMLKHNNKISNTLENVALLTVEDIYEPDFEKECLSVFGSMDQNHTFIKRVLDRKDDTYYFGGTITPVDPIVHYDFARFRHTPENIKMLTRNFKCVVGFQTRNPMHKCHYELTKHALETARDEYADTAIKDVLKDKDESKVLLLQPIVGVTQPDDVDYRVRVRCYEHTLKEYRKDGINVILSILELSMRMAGPREALWHALIRKNYGCTHFIVGRDHAGPSVKKQDGSSFYGPYDAHQFIKKYEKEIGLKVILSKELVYDVTLARYVELVQLTSDYINISGTELRRLLTSGKEVPEWFTFKEISTELARYYSSNLCGIKNANGPGTGGIVFYFVGLSGSGKTTTTNAFAKRLEELYDPRIITLLDGDDFRKNVSEGLGFSKEDRSINVRRMGYVAEKLAKSGGIVLCANIAPFKKDRDYNRQLIEKSAKYIEVYMNTPLKMCEERDVKGLYKKARRDEKIGICGDFTGISSPFEAPINPDISLLGDGDLQKSLDELMEFMDFVK